MNRYQALEQSRGPLGFKKAMYCAVIDRRKTQTRRILDCGVCTDKETYGDAENMIWLGEYGVREWNKPRYQEGEIYYLTEPVQIMEFWQHAGSCTVKYLWTGTFTKRWITDEETDKIIARKRGWNAPTTARFMLKSFAREFVRIKSVKVERLQDITPDDCRAEGMPAKNNDVGVRYAFGIVWKGIHGGGSWAANPWVWVYEFERVEVSS